MKVNKEFGGVEGIRIYIEDNCPSYDDDMIHVSRSSGPHAYQYTIIIAHKNGRGLELIKLQDSFMHSAVLDKYLVQLEEYFKTEVFDTGKYYEFYGPDNNVLPEYEGVWRFIGFEDSLSFLDKEVRPAVGDAGVRHVSKPLSGQGIRIPEHVMYD